MHRTPTQMPLGARSTFGVDPRFGTAAGGGAGMS